MKTLDSWITHITQSCWKTALVITSILATATTLILWPILSGHELFPPKFIGLYHYIYFSVMQHFTQDLGILPHWWPQYLSGYPIDIAFDAFLNPFIYIALQIFSPIAANNFLTFIFFIINGLSFYWLSRTLNRSRTGSLIGAISYGFSGFMIRWMDVADFSLLMPFLPLAFLCTYNIFHATRPWLWSGFLFILTAYGWFGGFPEITVYTLVGVSAWALYLNWRHPAPTGRWQPLLRLSLAIILSVLVLAPWFLSVVRFISLSQRFDGFSIEEASVMPVDSSFLLRFIHPRMDVLYGNLLPFISLGYAGDDFMLYIGTLPLLFVLASLFIPRDSSPPFLRFFQGLALGAFLIAVKHSPLYWLIHRLPVLQWFRMPWKWTMLIVFALAMVAVYGFDYFLAVRKTRAWQRCVKIMWVIALILITGLVIFTIFAPTIERFLVEYGSARYQSTPGRIFERSPEYYTGLLRSMASTLTSSFSLTNPVVITTAFLWILALLHISLGAQRLSSTQWRWSALLITFLGSTIIWIGIFNGPPVTFLTEEPATARYMHQTNPYRSDLLPLDTQALSRIQPYRIFNYFPDQFVSVLTEQTGINLANNKIREIFTKEMMDDNTHVAFNFDTFINHQALTLKRLSDLAQIVRRPTGIQSFQESLDTFSDSHNLRILGTLNVRYILTPFLFRTGSPVFTSTIYENKLPIYIYENPYFQPRWYFAHSIQWAENNNAAALQAFDSIADPIETTLLELQKPDDKNLNFARDSRDSFTPEYYGPGYFRVRTTTQHKRVFVFSESRFPDWYATIDGQPTTLYTANYLFQAVLVPPGEHIIEFIYPSLWEQSKIAARSFLVDILK